MKKFLLLVVDYWWIPGLIVAGLALSLFGQKAVQRILGEGLNQRLDGELHAIQVKKHVREVQIRQGRSQALRNVQIRYEYAFRELDDKQRARMAKLESNPAKLAQAMARLTR